MFENTFERIKELYITHKIDEDGLKRAVTMKLITEDEMEEILKSNEEA